MLITLSEEGKAALLAAVSEERRVRHWRRYQAIWLLGEGSALQAVAQVLGASLSSIYNWAAAYLREGLAGLKEARRQGREPILDDQAKEILAALLDSDPQARGHLATGWTVPPATEGTGRGRISGKRPTVRRMLHHLGWRWKRPKYVLGRPDPAYEAKRACPTGRGPSGRGPSPEGVGA